MKKLILILSIGLAAALPHLKNNSINDNDSPEGEWTMIPDGDGHFHLVNINELDRATASIPKKTLEVDFFLFTKTKPEGETISADVETLRDTSFNSKWPTRIITHGWGSDRNAPVCTILREAYLSRGNFNVIIADWSSGSKSPLYSVAKGYVPEAGERIAELIEFLHKEAGMSFNNLYLMGHSLGAHVAGFGGKKVKSGKVNTIYGLDPAGPLFPFSKPDQRLNASDAMYVEIIHTNAGALGTIHPIGHASFYANWGKAQPGCGLNLACSHGRPHRYLAESIAENNNFVALQCENHNDILDEKCGSPEGKNKVVKLGGEPSNLGLSGVFYVPTNDNPPYGIAKFKSTVSNLFNL